MTLPVSSKCRKHIYVTSSFSVDLPQPVSSLHESSKTTQRLTTLPLFLLFFLLPLDGCHLCDCLVHANLISLRFTYTAEAHIM